MKPNTTARNRDFIRRCFEIYEANLREGRRLSPGELVRVALHTRPKAHYLAFDSASKTLHRIERQGLGVFKEPVAQARCAELRSQVDEVRRVRKKLTFAAALSAVINFGRPSRFFMSEERALRILRPYYTRTFGFVNIQSDSQTRC